MKYVGLAFSLSMLEVMPCDLNVMPVTPEEVKAEMPELQSCCNPSHNATLIALREKFGIEVPVPATPPRVTLTDGDSIIVLQVSGLPRLTDRHEYTPEEIDRAKFSFLRVVVNEGYKA